MDIMLSFTLAFMVSVQKWNVSYFSPQYYYGIFLGIIGVCRPWKKLTCHNALPYEGVIFFSLFFPLQLTYF